MRLRTTLPLLAVLLVGGSRAAWAQEDEASPFASLGLPELAVTLTGDGFQAPTEIPAGLVHVSLDNQSTLESDGTFTLDLMQLPPEVSVDDLTEALASDEFPPFFFDLVLAGGVTAAPGEQNEAVLNLAPGTWYITNVDQLGVAPAALEVTGEPIADAPVPESAQTVHMTSYGFDFPVAFAAGAQVWEISNPSPVPHHIVILKADQAYSFEEVMAAFEASESGTPIAGGPSEDTITDFAYVNLLSPGQTMWVSLDFEPGEYIAMCFMSDSIDVAEFHAMQGMFDNFTVE